MATITSTPTAGSLTISGNTQVSGTISWSKPTVPSDVTITSCVLTGTATASMSKGSATITVNRTTVTSGSQFTIDLGTANNTTSVTTTAKGGNKNSAGTVTFSNLVYTVTYETSKPTYTVTFKDWDGSVLKTQTVEEGSSATAPSSPTRNGYDFTGWDTNFNNVTSNLNVTAQYSIKSYTVTFKDWDGTTLKTETVNHGSNATAPSNPIREGYEFTGWDTDFTDITNDLTVTAQYKETVVYDIKVVEYKFDNTLDVIPKFNSDFTYTYEDIVEGSITTRTIYSNSLPTSMNMGDNSHKLTYVEYIDISNLTTLRYMFNNCLMLTNINNINNWDTKNIISMQDMFCNCSSLTTLDIKNWNVGETTNMMEMFYLMTSITELDLSNWNTSNVTNMTYMFYDCKNLTTINLGTFNMNKVTGIDCMFLNCTNLTSIIMNNSDYNSVNKIISELPTRTSDSIGTLNIKGVDDFSQVDITTAQSKFWNIVGVESEEPEEDVIEWTGIGTVATNLSTENDWTYKLNIDWDTQYIEINNIVANGEAFSYGADVLYMNNEYNFTTGETFYIDDTETLVINGDSTEFYSFKFSIKISKNDGLVFTSNLNDNTYEIKNYHLIENSSVLYLSSLVRTSGNSYSTIGEIKVKSVEELKENIFPSFITKEWGTNGTFTIIEESDHNIRFTTDAPWSGPLYYAPYYWQGKTITLSCDTMSENTKFDIMTTSWGALFELTPENSPLTVTLPNEPIMFCLQSSAPDAGVAREVYATGLRITSEDSFENVPDAITSLNINKDIYYVGLSEEIIISCTVTPSDGVFGNLTWTANNPDLLLIEDGKSCIAVSDVIGNYTLTVTDSLTGLSDSCNVVVDDVTNSELFPPFTNGEWYLNSTCTEILKEDYSYSFECTEPWTAVSISIPDYWYGKSIEISCEDISENAGLYIQETDSWVEIGRLTLSSKSAILHVPNKGDYTDIIIALQAPTTPGIVSITNVTASLYGLDNDEDDGEGDIVEDFYNGKINLQYENRLIGYKKPDVEEIIEDAIICTNIGEVSRALSSVQPGQTIYLRRGKYVFGGSFIIRAAGTEGNYVTIKGYPGESVIIADTKLEFANPAKYLNFENLIIANVPDLHWGYAIKVHSGTSYINFRNLEIRNITCKIPEGSSETTTGCNPLVIYGDTVEGINNVNIENCYIHDCDTGWSEGLTLNGHVSNCLIKNCTIANITNIGIDLAGNYEWTGTVGDPENQTHDCIVENCLLVNCQSPYATSAGLYSDGARDNTFRYNVMYNCQCGIELGSEQPGAASENFYIHNNLIIDSGRAIGVGSYQETGAPNRNAYIYNNTIVCGDSNKENYGLYVERTDNVNFYNNIVYGTSNTTLFSNYYNSNVNVGNNCWYQPNGSKPEIDSTGIFGNHIFINNDLTLDGDYSLRHTSPCVNKGNSEVFDSEETFDLAGNSRIIGEGIDIGAFEHSGQPEEPETPSGIIIAQYKFNNSIDTLPTFNSEFIYEYIDADNGDGTITRTITSDSSPTSISFNGKTGLVSVSYLDTSNVTNMSGMFSECHSLTSLDLSNFDTSEVTDMTRMFYNCESLTSLDVSNFDTSNVKSMHLMFHGCNKVPVLDTTSWNTSKVTIMADMFAYCYNLTTMDLSNFNTSEVTNMSGMFNNCTALTTLTGLDQWNTSKATDMSLMFNGCNNLTSIDVSNFDTSKVTNMTDMFYGCNNLTSLDLSNWDTSNVTNMNSMFQYCNKLTSLNIPNMKFDKLTTITNFLQNSGIKQLNFSRNTLPEISMTDFMNDATSLNVIKCKNKNNIAKVIPHLPVRTVENPGKIITQVPISQFTELEIQALADKNWAISNEELVVVAKYKFAKDICRSMIPVFNEEFINYFVDDEYLDTEDLTGMYKSLPNKSNGESGKADYTITADNIVTRTISVLVDDVKPYNIRFGSHVINVSPTTKDRHKSGSIIEILDLNISTNYDAALMFNCCVNMINCNINGLNTDAALSMYGMFADCCKLTTLDINHLNVIKVQDFEAMFSNCESLTSLDVSNFNTGKATYMSYMFYNCYNLTTLDLSNFDTSEVNYMSYMFYDCSNLTTLDVSSFDTSKVIDMNCMFEGCYSLAQLDLSNFDTSQVTDMYSMFYDCCSLEDLDVSNWNVSNVTDMSYMFYCCESLTDLDVSNWNVINVNYMEGLFCNCCKLSQNTINGLRNWNVSNVTDMSYMLDCLDINDVTTIDLSGWNVSNVIDMSYMLEYILELKYLNLNNWILNENVDTTGLFKNNNNLEKVSIMNSNAFTINKIIAELPTRTADSMGTLETGSIDPESVNYTEASSKYWIISPDSTNIKHMHLGDMVISNLYIGEVEVKKVYLGEIIIYK